MTTTVTRINLAITYANKLGYLTPLTVTSDLARDVTHYERIPYAWNALQEELYISLTRSGKVRVETRNGTVLTLF